MSRPAVKLTTLHPKWVIHGENNQEHGLQFDCPEGHPSCWHTVPFTPDLAGNVAATWQQNGAVWSRVGETFETVSLQPSIRSSCGFHGYITLGEATFCDDSK